MMHDASTHQADLVMKSTSAASIDENRRGIVHSSLAVSPDETSSESTAMTSESEVENLQACVAHSAHSNSTAVVIVDLCDEDRDQEPVLGITTPQQVSPRIQTNVKFAQAKFIDNTQKEEKRQLLHPCTPPHQTLYRSDTGTSLTPIDIDAIQVKAEDEWTEECVVPNLTRKMSPALPLHLKDQIDEWYDRHPGQTPPFAKMCIPLVSLYVTASGAGASWWHRSGELLSVKWYDLPEHLYPKSVDGVPQQRVMVAEGPSLEPCFYRYAFSGGFPSRKGSGSAYKAWVGYDGFNTNGFELQPSIFKVTNVIDDGTSVTSGSLGTAQGLFESPQTSLRRNRRTPQRYGGLVSWASVLHPHLKAQNNVEEAVESAGGLIPPLMHSREVGNRHDLLQQAETNSETLRSSLPFGKPPKRHAPSSEGLEPPRKIARQAHDASALGEKILRPHRSLKQLLKGGVVSGTSQRMVDKELDNLIRRWSGEEREVQLISAAKDFKIEGSSLNKRIANWLSVNADPLVRLRLRQNNPKFRGPYARPESTLLIDPPSDRKQPEAASKVTVELPKLSTLRASIRPVDVEHPHNAPEKGNQGRPIELYLQEEPRQQNLDKHDTTLELSESKSAMVEEHKKQTESTATYALLDAHIRENTVMLFYADSSRVPRPSPRPRMMSSCDSVGKLFAQARAGAVFAQSIDNGDSLVVALKLNNRASMLPLVQDDNEDFQNFMSALRQTTCWTVGATGNFEGSCIVEVRGLV
jgi:hypothetical protein